MTKEEILTWARSIKVNPNEYYYSGYVSEIKELIRAYYGKNNSFYEELESIKPEWHQPDAIIFASQTLRAFIKVVDSDYISISSLQRKIQTEVVSDILEQSSILLNDKNSHPATSAVLIGASLEEFLRNWIEQENLELGNKRPSIDCYANVLRKNELISKQDIKDITSWAGIRNDAAHGNWESVKDRSRINLMLEGVNLFMRKYS